MKADLIILYVELNILTVGIFMSVNVRDFQAGDFEKINSLWRRTDMTSEERSDDAEVIWRTLERGGRFFVLEEGEEEIIGTAWVTDDGRRLYLHHLVVDPDYRGRGYGKLLTKKTLKFVGEKGRQIKLEVHDDNVPAIGLYEKYGFKKLRNYDVFIIRDVNENKE